MAAMFGIQVPTIVLLGILVYRKIFSVDALLGNMVLEM